MSDTQAKAGRMVECMFNRNELIMLRDSVQVDIESEQLSRWVDPELSDETLRDLYTLRDRLSDLIQDATND